MKGFQHMVMLYFLNNCCLILWELSPSLPVAFLGQFDGIKLLSMTESLPWSLLGHT